MFRNQYDTDVTVWSPQGNLYQVDYAMEAVKQGSACVGLKSKDLVVLAALKRSANPLSEHQKKVFSIDRHMGIAIAGLTSDARSIARFMRTECLNHKFVYGSALPVGRLVGDLADRMQECTQSYVRRPYGVGLLVAGYDKTGPHLYQTCPSGIYYEFEAMAIGSRAQSARTYLEKHFKTFDGLSKDEMIQHGLQALRGCLQGDDELTPANAAISYVGKDQDLVILEGESLKPYLDAMVVADKTADEAKMEE